MDPASECGMTFEKERSHEWRQPTMNVGTQSPHHPFGKLRSHLDSRHSAMVALASQNVRPRDTHGVELVFGPDAFGRDSLEFSLVTFFFSRKRK
jgi:hypothetical protein